MVCFLGIDPGLNGSIAVLENVKARVIDIPVIVEKKKGKHGKEKIRHRYNINALVEIFKGFDPPSDYMAVLEYSSPMPSQGVTYQFSIGFGFGMYQALLSMQYIRYEIIRAQKWQREFMLSGDTKSKSYQVASRMFPEVELVTPRGRILDGRSDALLLAEFCRRTYGGK